MLSLFAKHRSQQWEPRATTVRAFRGVWPVQVLSSLVWYSSNVESIYWEHSPPLLTFEAWLFQCKQVKAIGTKDHALMRQDALNTSRAVVEAVKASAWTKWLSEFIIVYIYYVWSEWLSTKSLYKPIYVSSNFVVKSVTSLNSLMSTESFACDQNRTARTYYRLRTASLEDSLSSFLRWSDCTSILPAWRCPMKRYGTELLAPCCTNFAPYNSAS